MDSTTQAGPTPAGMFCSFFLLLVIADRSLRLGSTAPFQPLNNHNQSYHSGMLRSWNKFCFMSGYINLAVSFSGPDENIKGYVRLLSQVRDGQEH
jgi:Beta-glucan synthesis-associated protein SKN1/KRE6/Sbg1